LAMKSMAVDLGTAITVIYVKDRGIVLREPSIAAVTDDRRQRVVAVGEEAKRMLGRTPEGIKSVRPMRDGVIADFRITEEMLRMFVKNALSIAGFASGRFNMVICVPCNITYSEKRAVEDAARHAGAREAYVAEEPVAAAIGAGLQVNQPRGNMIVDIGGGTSDIAVITMGGTAVARSLRVGGVKMDDAIIHYMKRQYGVIIGEKTAEEIKIQAGTAIEHKNGPSVMVRGRDSVSGMPANVEVTSRELCIAMKDQIDTIVAEIKSVLAETPPELVADIMQYGITLAGGGALLNDLPERLRYETGIPVRIAEHPMDCVALGAGRIVEELEHIKRGVR